MSAEGIVFWLCARFVKIYFCSVWVVLHWISTCVGVQKPAWMVYLFNSNNLVPEFFWVHDKMISFSHHNYFDLAGNLMICLTPCIMTSGPHFKCPKCGDIYSGIFLLVQGCVAVFGQQVEIHAAFSYKYFWTQSVCRMFLLSLPVMEAFSLLTIHLGADFMSRDCPSFTQCVLYW